MRCSGGGESQIGIRSALARKSAKAISGMHIFLLAPLVALSAIFVSPPARADTIQETFANRPNPFWLDMRKNCGPVCLQFVCEYFGKPKDMATVARACPVGVHGTTVGALEKAGRELGLHTRAFRGSARQLSRLRGVAIVLRICGG